MFHELCYLAWEVICTIRHPDGEWRIQAVGEAFTGEPCTVQIPHAKSLSPKVHSVSNLLCANFQGQALTVCKLTRARPSQWIVSHGPHSDPLSGKQA